MVYEEVAYMLANMLNLEEEDVSPGMALFSDAEIERIHIAKLIIECERKFKVVIHDEKVCGFHRVSDLVKYIESSLSDNEGNLAESTEEERAGWHYE